MASSTDWQSSLGFTVINRSTAYGAAFPSSATSEGQQEARILESDAFQNAIDEADYLARCNAVADELLGKRTCPEDSDLREHATGEVTTAIGMTIGSYKSALHHRDGLFSNVFKAESPKDSSTSGSEGNTTVALKVTVPMAMDPPHNSLREARLLKRCQSDHVIPLLEMFEQSGGRLVLVFPFMPCDLEHLIRDPSFSVENRKTCLRDLFSALKHLHSLGIIHRDVKPSNVLLESPSGPAYLADFGIAWAEDDEASEPAESKITDVGTTCYRPPELLFGNTKYGTALDMWAAGCVVAEVVNGGQETLFDSGDLGSELALIQSMFKKLGTPTTEIWPEAVTYPDWGKMQFYEYPAQDWSDLLVRASDEGRDLVAKLVKYESGDRFSAAQVLEHPYLQTKQ